MRCRGLPLINLIVIGQLVFVVSLSPITLSHYQIVEDRGAPLGWSDNINLSNDPIYRDIVPQIAVNGNNIHSVWLHDYQEVYYSKSTDCGLSWSTPLSLYQFVPIYNPYIAVSGDNVHVAWSTYKVMYRNSTNNGDTWNPTIDIFNATGSQAYCAGIYVNKTNIHIFSFDLRDGPEVEIYYRRSLDGGISFDNGQGLDADRRLTFGQICKNDFTTNGDGSNVSIAWTDERSGIFDTYWMISKDNGFTWEDGLGNIGQDRRLTTTGADYCTIAVNQSNIHLVYVDPTTVVEYRLYYRNSTDNGATWNTPVLITGPWAGITQVGLDVEGNNVHIAWGDERIDGIHDELFYKNSTDGGINWSTDIRLTFNLTRDSFHPKIAVENDIRHIVWYDRWPGNGDREVFYKRYPDFPIPEYNISLQEGWNLISLPHEQSNESIAAVLSSINGKWDYLQAYDSLAPEPWKTYATFKPSQLNELQFLNHRMGFWINVTEPGGTVLTVSGPIPDSTSISLYAGWNMVGYPTQTTETIANALWGTGADKVEKFDSMAPYRINEVEPTYIMKPGEGYWVHVPADTVWIVDW